MQTSFSIPSINKLLFNKNEFEELAIYFFKICLTVWREFWSAVCNLSISKDVGGAKINSQNFGNKAKEFKCFRDTSEVV